MTNNQRVAAIGAGHWGINLVQKLSELNALAAIAESDRHLRQKLRADYPETLVCEDYHSLLQSNVPAVVITTPASTHYDIAREALLADKDVFVEKPMTLSVPEAKELVRLAQKRSRILMVGHLLLYQPAIQEIKSFLESGALGQLYSLHQERLNLGRVRDVENVLWSLGTHDIAVLLHLVGKAPVSIQAIGQRLLRPTIEDDVYLHINFPGDVKAHLHVSWLWPVKHRQLMIIGAKGMLVYDELNQTVTLHHKSFGSKFEKRDGGTELLFQGSGDPLGFELEHFLKCIETRQRPVSHGESALEVIQVLSTARERLKEGWE